MGRVGFAVQGLSPHVRGSQIGMPSASGGTGSIPACAGEPVERPLIVPSVKVYPRMCGGAAGPTSRRGFAAGLSPHVRGSQNAAITEGNITGSIPACAGEP